MIRDPTYLLDTNVISETRKPRLHPHVQAFFDRVEGPQLFLSVLTMGELYKGIIFRRRTDQIAADRIAEWVERLELRYADRILPVDLQVAYRWGQLSSDRSRPVVDTLIAATALVHDLTLVTRNVRDMRGLNVRMIDPWEMG